MADAKPLMTMPSIIMPPINVEPGENPGENEIDLISEVPLGPVGIFIKLKVKEKIAGEIGVAEYLYLGGPASVPLILKFYYYTPVNEK